MAAYEKHTQPCTARTCFSPFLMGDNFSASTGGGYSDLVNFSNYQFSHKRTRNVDTMPQGASFFIRRALPCLRVFFENSLDFSLRPWKTTIDNLSTSDKYKFSKQQPQVLQRKRHQMTFEPSAQSWKRHQIAFEPFAQVGKCLEQRGNSSAQVGKYTKQRRNSFAQLGKYTKHCGNSSAQVGKYTKHCGNSFAQVGKYTKQHGNSSAQVGKYTKQRGNWSQRDALLTEFCLACMARIFASQKPSKLAFPQVGICTKQHGNIIRHLDRLGDQTVIEPVEITAACLRQQNTHKMEA